ncbi:MAG: 2-oxoacid:acceptor oxidoreductase family protein [Lachnoclostridium sp.]
MNRRGSTMPFISSGRRHHGCQQKGSETGNIYTGGQPYDGSEMLSYLEEHVEHLLVMDGDSVCSQVGSDKVLNVAMLGAAVASGVLDISMSDMEEEIKKNVKPQFVEMNRKHFLLERRLWV